MIDVMVRGFPWYPHPAGIGAGRRPGDRRPCLPPGSETNLLMGWFGLSSNQSTWAISIVAEQRREDVEGLASDALAERVFRLVRRVSQEHEHAHFAEGTAGRLLKDEALPVPAHH